MTYYLDYFGEILYKTTQHFVPAASDATKKCKSLSQAPYSNPEDIATLDQTIRHMISKLPK